MRSPLPRRLRIHLRALLVNRTGSRLACGPAGLRRGLLRGGDPHTQNAGNHCNQKRFHTLAPPWDSRIRKPPTTRMRISSLSFAATLPTWRSPCPTGKTLRINDVSKSKVCLQSLAEHGFHTAEKVWTGAKKCPVDS